MAQIRAEAEALSERGPQPIYLLRGEPDFATPTHICEAAIEAIRAGETHYPPARGIPELRGAVSERIQRDFQLSLDPDTEILITSGATMGLYAAVMAVVDPGDEVLLFDPCYDPYYTIVRSAGGVTVPLAAQEIGGHFFVSPDTIHNAITDRTRAMLINNPWNPTGTVMRMEELQALVELAETHDLVLIVDEIYEHIVFAGHQHRNLASLSAAARARTITVNSFSKSYAMTGWRLGYTLAPPELTTAMSRVSVQFSRSAASFVQHAGIVALSESQSITGSAVQAYARRRALMMAIFRDAEIRTFRPPEGTFFLFLDIRAYGISSEQMSRYLLHQAHVVTVPGSAYGPAGEGYLRLSFAYADETVRAGAEAVAAALTALE